MASREFAAITGLLRKSDAEIAAEMAKVTDFEMLANKLALYDKEAINRIVQGVPMENRALVRRLTKEVQEKNYGNAPDSAFRFQTPRIVYHSTRVNFKRLFPALLLSLLLLHLSGYLV
jgi:ribosomal 50S subunit-associated protein YjgA (DUF615 family)